jgi:hypothetical protein
MARGMTHEEMQNEVDNVIHHRSLLYLIEWLATRTPHLQQQRSMLRIAIEWERLDVVMYLVEELGVHPNALFYDCGAERPALPDECYNPIGLYLLHKRKHFNTTAWEWRWGLRAAK